MKQQTPMRPPEFEWPDWMKIANAETGVRELFGSRATPRILEYYGATKGMLPRDDDVPWCSAFVCWCLEKAGYASTRSKAARSFLRFGDFLEHPRYGCVIVFSRSSPSNPLAGHVGFYAGPSGPGEVWVLGGNQNNRVGLATRPMSTCIGIRWPVAKLGE